MRITGIGRGVDLWGKIVYDRNDTHGMEWGGTAMYESGENYLETILRLREKNGTVCSIRMEPIISEEVFLEIKRFMSEQSLQVSAFLYLWM